MQPLYVKQFSLLRVRFPEIYSCCGKKGNVTVEREEPKWRK
jgi:hypothetical protein